MRSIRATKRIMSGGLAALAASGAIRAFARPSILLYHEVADPARSILPASLVVHPGRFEAHIAWLKRNATPVPLIYLLRRIAMGTPVPRDAVAVTFDDGFRGAARNAWPILRRYGVPASYFVVSGWVESRTLATRHILNLVMTRRAWPDVQRAMGSLGPPVESHIALHRFLRDRPEHAADIAGRLRQFVGPSEEEAAAVALYASQDDIERVVAEGAALYPHTANHVRLASIPVDRQRTEVERSVAFVRDLTGVSPKVFAYPFGRKDDFGPEAEAIVAASGIPFAVTIEDGPLDKTAHPLHIPRHSAQDQPVGEFAWNLWRRSRFNASFRDRLGPYDA